MSSTATQKARRLAKKNAARQAHAAATRAQIQYERVIAHSLRRSNAWDNMQNLTQAEKSNMARSELGQSFTRQTVANPHKVDEAVMLDVDQMSQTRRNSYPAHSRQDLKVRAARGNLRRHMRAGKQIGLMPKKIRELFAVEFPADNLLLNPID